MRKHVLLPIFIFVMNIAYSATISYKNEMYPGDYATNGDILHIDGEISAGDAKKLSKIIKDDPERFLKSGMISLNSPGGNVKEAFLLSDLVRQLGQKVVVFKPNACLSACFFIYVNAKIRYATDSSIGIHRPYLPKDAALRRSLEAMETDSEKFYTYLKSWLESRDTPKYLVELMFSRSSKEIYWLNDNDISRLRTMSTYYEEWLLARCPNYSNSEKNFFINPNDNSTRSAFQKSVQCEKNYLNEYQREQMMKFISSN